MHLRKLLPELISYTYFLQDRKRRDALALQQQLQQSTSAVQPVQVAPSRVAEELLRIIGKTTDIAVINGLQERCSEYLRMYKHTYGVFIESQRLCEEVEAQHALLGTNESLLGTAHEKAAPLRVKIDEKSCSLDQPPHQTIEQERAALEERLRAVGEGVHAAEQARRREEEKLAKAQAELTALNTRYEELLTEFRALVKREKILKRDKRGEELASEVNDLRLEGNTLQEQARKLQHSNTTLVENIKKIKDDQRREVSHIQSQIAVEVAAACQAAEERASKAATAHQRLTATLRSMLRDAETAVASLEDAVQPPPVGAGTGAGAGHGHSATDDEEEMHDGGAGGGVYRSGAGAGDSQEHAEGGGVGDGGASQQSHAGGFQAWSQPVYNMGGVLASQGSQSNSSSEVPRSQGSGAGAAAGRGAGGPGSGSLV